jgi:imidazolonepropionase
MLPQARERALAGAPKKASAHALKHSSMFSATRVTFAGSDQTPIDAGRANDFALKVHADDFVNMGATTVAAQCGATSCDRLLNISETEIELLSQSKTVAVLLPGTSFYLNLCEHVPARKTIDSGVALALGSDFNPGSCRIFSLTMILGLAFLHLKMTPQEALTALTLNAVWDVGQGDSIGMLREGYQADITIYDVSTLEEIPSNIGWNTVVNVIKRGSLVVA